MGETRPLMCNFVRACVCIPHVHLSCDYIRISKGFVTLKNPEHVPAAHEQLPSSAQSPPPGACMLSGVFCQLVSSSPNIFIPVYCFPRLSSWNPPRDTLAIIGL